MYRLHRAMLAYQDARGQADSVISDLSPAAWYRNATDVVSSGGFASIWADYASSDKGLVLPGVAGNYASTPDSVPLSITGDLELIWRCLLNDWTPSSEQTFINKWAGGNSSFRTYLNASGAMLFSYSNDGTAARTATSSASVSGTEGVPLWLRVTYASATGKVNFYKAADSTSIPTSWTAVGSEQTLTAGSIFDSTAVVAIGIYGDFSSSPTSGKFYRAIVKDGIDGTTVFDADFSSQAIGAGSFTESSSNAATVTINASGASPAHIGKARDLLQGTGTNQPAYAAGVFTFDGVDNYLKTSAFTLNQPETIYLVVNAVSWTAEDRIFDGNSSDLMDFAQKTATPQVGLYSGSGWVALNGDLTVGAYKVACTVFNGASSLIQINSGTATTGNPGASNAGGFTLGAGASPGPYANIAVKECVIFAAAHDATTRASVITSIMSLFSIT